MNIQNVKTTPAFQAKTTITAPAEFVSKEAIAGFQKIGNAIGKETDKIDIFISGLHGNKANSKIQTYTAKQNVFLERSASEAKRPYILDGYQNEIPYIRDGKVIEKNSPANYIKTVLERLTKEAEGYNGF